MDRNLAEIIREDIDRLCRISVVKPSPTERLLEGERRKVAILFLDIKGFSSLSETLDHETVHLIIDGVMGALARVVELHGGYVDKFEGDLIMALFGARNSAEYDSIRAVTSALRMLETLQEANGVLSETGINLEARVGISAGNVTVAPDPSGHMTATGDEVNLARRMESAAEPGTVLATSGVQRESSRHFNWESLGAIEVKGFGRLIETFRPLDTRADPGDEFHWGSQEEISFAGRDREVKDLEIFFREYLERYHESNADYQVKHSMITLEGSAGIGKSRLIREFLSGFQQASGVRILEGSTASFAQPPYRVWTSILQKLLGFGRSMDITYNQLENTVRDVLQTDDLSDRLKRGIPFIAMLLPNCFDANRLRKINDTALHNETVSAIGSLLDALAHMSPLILLMEDIHNIDEVSLSTLESIISGVHCGKPIMVVFVRRREPPSFYTDISSISDAACVSHNILLEEMADKDLTRMIEERLDDVTPMVSQLLLDRSRGNPYFLEEMINYLIESGAISKREGMFDFCTDTGNIHVPPSLDGLLQSRIDRLPVNLKIALQCASVLGHEISLDIYASMVKRLHIDIDPEVNLIELEQRGFMERSQDQDGTVYRFRSLLMKDAVYALLLHYNRQLLHSIAARVIIDDPFFSPEERAPALAIHLYMSGETAKAVNWGMKALLSSARASENNEVLEWTSRLLKWIEMKEECSLNSDEVVNILQHRQSALLHLGRIEEAGSILDRINSIAGANVDDRIRISALNSSVRFHIVRNKVEEAAALLKRAGNLNRGRYPQEQAATVYLQGILKRNEGLDSQAEKLYRRALTIAESVGDKSLLGHILGSLGIVTRVLGSDEDAMELYQSSLSIHRETGNRADEITVLYNIANIYCDRGELEEGEKNYIQVIQNAEETGSMRILGSALGALGTVYSEMGDPGKGLEYLSKAEKIFRRIGYFHEVAWHITNKVEIHIESEDWDKAWSNLAESMELSEKYGLLPMTGYNHSLLARILLKRDECSRARESAEKGLRILRETGSPFDIVVAFISMGLVEAAGGHLEKASAAYTEARNIITQHDLSGNLSVGLQQLRAVLMESGVKDKDIPLPANW